MDRLTDQPTTFSEMGSMSSKDMLKARQQTYVELGNFSMAYFSYIPWYVVGDVK